ncbi:MAG TPA: HAD-IIIA family hydrolase [Catalimonadaceae bacterium]|nr:HAD-IIIA family hydrolase [Catalimonadaceae bacterium]
MNKCILLDRDGVLNEEKGDYVFRDEDFIIPDDVPQGLRALKEAGYKLVVVTNQGGISKGLFTKEMVFQLHQKVQNACGNAIDHLLYAPLHRNFTKSLASKPGSLMMERGLALTQSDPSQSWLIGDAERDLIAGKQAGVRTILIPTLKEKESEYADMVCRSFGEAVQYILGSEPNLS